MLRGAVTDTTIEVTTAGPGEQSFYGMNASTILNGGVSTIPQAVNIYPKTLSRY